MLEALAAAAAATALYWLLITLMVAQNPECFALRHSHLKYVLLISICLLQNINIVAESSITEASVYYRTVFMAVTSILSEEVQYILTGTSTSCSPVSV